MYDSTWKRRHHHYSFFAFAVLVLLVLVSVFRLFFINGSPDYQHGSGSSGPPPGDGVARKVPSLYNGSCAGQRCRRPQAASPAAKVCRTLQQQYDEDNLFERWRHRQEEKNSGHTQVHVIGEDGMRHTAIVRHVLSDGASIDEGSGVHHGFLRGTQHSDNIQLHVSEHTGQLQMLVSRRQMEPGEPVVAVFVILLSRKDIPLIQKQKLAATLKGIASQLPDRRGTSDDALDEDEDEEDDRHVNPSVIIVINDDAISPRHESPSNDTAILSFARAHYGSRLEIADLVHVNASNRTDTGLEELRNNLGVQHMKLKEGSSHKKALPVYRRIMEVKQQLVELRHNHVAWPFVSVNDFEGWMQHVAPDLARGRTFLRVLGHLDELGEILWMQHSGTVVLSPKFARSKLVRHLNSNFTALSQHGFVSDEHLRKVFDIEDEQRVRQARDALVHLSVTIPIASSSTLFVPALLKHRRPADVWSGLDSTKHIVGRRLLATRNETAWTPAVLQHLQASVGEWLGFDAANLDLWEGGLKFVDHHNVTVVVQMTRDWKMLDLYAHSPSTEAGSCVGAVEHVMQLALQAWHRTRPEVGCEFFFLSPRLLREAQEPRPKDIYLGYTWKTLFNFNNIHNTSVSVTPTTIIHGGAQPAANFSESLADVIGHGAQRVLVAGYDEVTVAVATMLRDVLHELKVSSVFVQSVDDDYGSKKFNDTAADFDPHWVYVVQPAPQGLTDHLLATRLPIDCGDGPRSGRLTLATPTDFASLPNAEFSWCQGPNDEVTALPLLSKSEVPSHVWRALFADGNVLRRAHASIADGSLRQLIEPQQPQQQQQQPTEAVPHDEVQPEREAPGHQGAFCVQLLCFVVSAIAIAMLLVLSILVPALALSFRSAATSAPVKWEPQAKTYLEASDDHRERIGEGLQEANKDFQQLSQILVAFFQRVQTRERSFFLQTLLRRRRRRRWRRRRRHRKQQLVTSRDVDELLKQLRHLIKSSRKKAEQQAEENRHSGNQIRRRRQRLVQPAQLPVQDVCVLALFVDTQHTLVSGRGEPYKIEHEAESKWPDQNGTRPIFSTPFQPSKKTIEDSLTMHRPHVIHLSGHVNKQGEMEVFHDCGASTGYQEEHSTLSWKDFCEVIAAHTQQPGCRLMVILLNTCNGDLLAEGLRNHKDTCHLSLIYAKGDLCDRAGFDFATVFWAEVAQGKTMKACLETAVEWARLSRRSSADPPCEYEWHLTTEALQDISVQELICRAEQRGFSGLQGCVCV